jgi:hypothetical protein
VGSVVLSDDAESYDILKVSYVYCDRCGSFSVAEYLDLRTALIAVLLLLAFGGSYYRFFWLTNDDNLRAFGFLFMVLTFLFVHSLLEAFPPSHGHGHRCRKCRTKIVSYENTRGFPEYDLSILDVPELLTHIY